MRPVHCLAFGFSLLCAGFAPTNLAHAQLGLLQPGVHVRVPGGLQGVVASRNADTLYLLTKSGLPTPIPLREVKVLQVRGEKNHGAGARRGALIGGAIGLPTGLALWARGDSTACRDYTGTPQGSDCRRTFGAGDAAMTAIGSALLGAGIGALVGRREWFTIRTETAVAPQLYVLPGRRLAFAAKLH